MNIPTRLVFVRLVPALRIPVADQPLGYAGLVVRAPEQAVALAVHTVGAVREIGAVGTAELTLVQVLSVAESLVVVTSEAGCVGAKGGVAAGAGRT